MPPLVAPRLPIDSPRIAPVSSDSLRLSWSPARIPAYARKAPITYSVEMKEPQESAWRSVTSKLTDTYYQVTLVFLEKYSSAMFSFLGNR